MTSSEISSWDPDAIHTVFSAATDHATNTRFTSRALVNIIDTKDPLTIGQVHALADRASEQEINDRIVDNDLRAAAEHARKALWLDRATALAGHIPVVGEYAGDAKMLLDEIFVGAAPGTTQGVDSAPHGSLTVKYPIVAELFGKGLGDTGALSKYLDGSGGLQGFEAALSGPNGAGLQADVDAYLKSTGIDLAEVWGNYREGFTNTTLGNPVINTHENRPPADGPPR